MKRASVSTLLAAQWLTIALAGGAPFPVLAQTGAAPVVTNPTNRTVAPVKAGEPATVVPAAASVQRAFAEMTPTFNNLDALFSRISASERKVIERFLGQLAELYRAAVRPARPGE